MFSLICVRYYWRFQHSVIFNVARHPFRFYLLLILTGDSPLIRIARSGLSGVGGGAVNSLAGSLLNSKLEVRMDFTLIGAIMVALLALWGVRAQIKASETNITKLVKEELEKEKKLLVEKIKLERDDRWWNIKLELFIEVSNLTLSIFKMVAGGDFFDGSMVCRGLAIRSRVLFSNAGIADNLKKCADYILKMATEEDETFDVEDVGEMLAIAIAFMENELDIGKGSLKNAS